MAQNSRFYLPTGICKTIFKFPNLQISKLFGQIKTRLNGGFLFIQVVLF
jgi:hypothetical protein